MNILVLAGDIPATTNMPGSPRPFNFCRQLSKTHQISLVAICQNQEKYHQFMNDPYSVGVFSETTILPCPQSFTWLTKQNHRLHFASHLVTKYLFPKYHRKICSHISEKITSNGDIDIIYIDGLAMTQYVGASQKVPVVVDLCDSVTLFYDRLAKLEKQLLEKLSISLEKRCISKMEKSVAVSFDLVITASSIDELVIKKLSPSSATLTISNGVDCEYFSSSNNIPNRQKLIFTGVMDYGPNEDAVLYFCREIFPRIKEHFSSAEFWVVGQGPSLKIQSLTKQGGVNVTGKVVDVRPYLQSAGIFVCPLRYGAGIKNKILAAMAMGIPIVATPISLEGIDVKPDQEVLVANNTEDFVRKVIKLITDENLARHLAENGYRLVKGKYSWETRAKSLESVFKNLIVKQKSNR